ncbi:glutamate-5-semialdehyde dehydrogenase [uncultured Oscillibacter sp.]|uniref:glutamate-5-semialdehyde dehydrogenase n=1 Tax=uncultured Oscillibacter sp. TaxID=876091 RepID=UPI00260EE871|nr:glutamate-5-semialdehyde dehydrogenase [uncultured Oscillibacter sp.]
MTALQQQGAAAKTASYILAAAGTEKKNAALDAIATILTQRRDEWLSANAADIAAAKEAGMRPAMLDRLTLTEERIAGIVEAVRQVIALPDPIGKVDKMETRPNGLIIGRRRVPLGVVAIIFEARPNVTVDAAALCLKSGNVCILRGGKEAIRSNRKAAELMREALASAGLPEDCVSLVQDTSHETANELMHLDGCVDVLIPRGGAGLIRAVAREASVPVIRTGEGICHVYIDSEADLDMGAEILYNAKCSRPSVCNAAECLLVQRDIAEAFLKKALPLLDRHRVELRCDETALAILGDRGTAAAESDWDAEYDDYILAVRTVADMEEAIGFINAHGTGHSEAIVTTNYFKAQRFLNEVDAAAVYVNASTRFTDGGEFGLGAEIGISTQKMHARGPMGLEELTSCKYVVYGEGQVR